MTEVTETVVNEVKDEITVKRAVVKYLKDTGRKDSWIAKQIGISQSHFHFIFKGKKSEGKYRKLTPEVLEKVNKVLGTKFGQ